MVVHEGETIYFKLQFLGEQVDEDGVCYQGLHIPQGRYPAAIASPLLENVVVQFLQL